MRRSSRSHEPSSPPVSGFLGFGLPPGGRRGFVPRGFELLGFDPRPPEPRGFDPRPFPFGLSPGGVPLRPPRALEPEPVRLPPGGGFRDVGHHCAHSPRRPRSSADRALIAPNHPLFLGV